MKTKTGISLGLMMFLEYFIWGAWYATLETYINNSMHYYGGKIGKSY